MYDDGRFDVWTHLEDVYVSKGAIVEVIHSL